MKYYIIAGEASGDLHASNLMKELKKLDSDAYFRCWGGDLMNIEGAELVKHYRDLAFMGFVEVLANIRTIARNISFCKQDILSYKPDVLILVDYPGFNLRIADFAKQSGFKVIYYISPQVWAWKQSRVKKIKKAVDKMLVILPFEKEFYKRFDYDVDFVGHPLLDAISQISEASSDEIKKEMDLSGKRIIALLPGSRKQEISVMLPEMLKVVNSFPDYQFVVAAVTTHGMDFYREICADTPVKIVTGQTYPLLRISDAALVTSGTATLETALFGVPEVVCYKGSFISYHLARSLVKVDYISLVNLIMKMEVVKELIQQEFNFMNLKKELQRILNDDVRGKMKYKFSELRDHLGGIGASKNAARLIAGFLKH